MRRLFWHRNPYEMGDGKMTKPHKYLTVMAVLDAETQRRLTSLRQAFAGLYGPDTETAALPFHITLGSFPPEEEAEIVSRMKQAAAHGPVPVQFSGLMLLGGRVRCIAPVKTEALLRLQSPFDKDYAEGYPDWLPHSSVYRHGNPAEEKLPAPLPEMADEIRTGSIVELMLGEFSPLRMVERVSLTPPEPPQG